MEKLIKFSIAVFILIMLVQSLEVIRYLLDQPDTCLFTLGIVVLGVMWICTVTSIVYILGDLNKNKK